MKSLRLERRQLITLQKGPQFQQSFSPGWAGLLCCIKGLVNQRVYFVSAVYWAALDEERETAKCVKTSCDRSKARLEQGTEQLITYCFGIRFPNQSPLLHSTFAFNPSKHQGLFQ